MAFGYCYRLRLCVCQSVCQPLACPRDNSGPVQARMAKFGPKLQNTLVKIPIVLGGNWPCQIKLKSQNLPHFEFVHTITHYPFKLGSPNLDQMWKIAWLISLNCFTGLTVLWPPYSVHTYIPGLFHGPDCFKVSTRCTHTDLGSRGYFGVYHRSCLLCRQICWYLVVVVWYNINLYSPRWCMRWDFICLFIYLLST